MTLCVIIRRKGLEGAGRCEDGVRHCVLLYEGRGQRELVGVKIVYDIICCYTKEGANVSW